MNDLQGHNKTSAVNFDAVNVSLSPFENLTAGWVLVLALQFLTSHPKILSFVWESASKIFDSACQTSLSQSKLFTLIVHLSASYIPLPLPLGYEDTTSLLYLLRYLTVIFVCLLVVRTQQI